MPDLTFFFGLAVGVGLFLVVGGIYFRFFGTPELTDAEISRFIEGSLARRRKDEERRRKDEEAIGITEHSDELRETPKRIEKWDD